MKKRLFLIVAMLATLLSTSAWVNPRLEVVRAEGADVEVPSGTLVIEKTGPAVPYQVVVSGSYEGTEDWGACIDWNDGSGDITCFPGFSGTFDGVTHVMKDAPGDYEILLVLRNGDQAEVVSGTVSFMPPPTGGLELLKGEWWEPLKYEVEVISANSSDWGTCVDWGDGSGETCFPGFGGVYTATHSVAMPGSYTVILRVENEDHPPFETSAQITFMPPPEGTLLTQMGTEPLSLAFELDYINTDDWGTCIEFGDGTRACYPGEFGQVYDYHVYPSWGTYVVTATFQNSDWAPLVVTDTVVFDQPESPEGNLEVVIIDMATLAVQATGTFVGANPDYGTCLWWGDGPDEVVCFEGSEGSFSETHQYPELGVYTPTLTIEGPEGTELFSLTQEIEFVPVELPVEGQMQVEIVDKAGLEIQVSGSFTGTVESACVSFGDQTSICTPGLESPFVLGHVFEFPEIFNVVMTVFGPTPSNKDLISIEVDLRQPTVLPPEVQLSVEIVPGATNTIIATGECVNVTDCVLSFGDGQSIGYPGLTITAPFTFTHTYEDRKEFTLMLWGMAADGTQAIAEVVIDLTEKPGNGHKKYMPMVFAVYPPPPPVCKIETNMVTGHMAVTTITWDYFPENDWSFLFWGDELENNAEPVGFLGISGEQTWTHVYKDGIWVQEVKILDGKELVTVCSHTITVP